MLSFLREQGAMHLHKSKDGSNPAAQGSEGNEQYLTVSSRGKQVRKSTIVLAVIFGIGAVCLWVMIKKSTPQSASAQGADAEQAQIETAISRITGVRSETLDRMDQIVDKFYEFSDVKQVGVNELSKNPFQHQMLSSETMQKADNGNDRSATAELMRQQQLWQQSREMQLLTIMQSEQGNCCMIDDKILYKGDTIRDFKVVEVGDTSVKLESNGVDIELKLSE